MNIVKISRTAKDIQLCRPDLSTNIAFQFVDVKDELSHLFLGTGASCIYPLLGAQKNKWNFLATEVDSFSVGYAKKNVDANGLQEKIKGKDNLDEEVIQQYL